MVDGLHHPRTAFLELRQRHSTFRIASRMLELMSPLLADNDVNGGDDDEHDDSGDHRDDGDRAEELATLLRWARIDCFDRRVVNRQLAEPGITSVRAAP